MQKVQEQLRRVALLTSIGEYDSARMELREGAASSLRKDLRAASEDFEAIKEQVGPVRPFLYPGVASLGRIRCEHTDCGRS